MSFWDYSMTSIPLGASFSSKYWVLFIYENALRRGGKNTQKSCTEKISTIQVITMVTHLEPDILEWEVNWAFGSITANKATGGDGIPVELFQILKDDAVKVLQSKYQQIWKTL